MFKCIAVVGNPKPRQLIAGSFSVHLLPEYSLMCWWLVTLKGKVIYVWDKFLPHRLHRVLCR